MSNEIEKVKQQEDVNENILVAFNNGEWCDSQEVCRLLNITFKQGLQEFEFSRTAEWNKPPLNGQKIITKFRKKYE